MYRIATGPLVFLILGLCTNQECAYCQTAPVDDSETSIPVEPETEEFKAAVDALRKNLQALREVMVRFNIGDATEDRGWKEKWLELRATGVGLHSAMIDAAIAEFGLNPAKKTNLGHMLFKILKRNVESDRYEGMLDVAQVLIDSDYPDRNMLEYRAWVAIALNRYDILMPMLDELARLGNAPELLTYWHENFDDFQQDWNEEVAAREKDRAGEPLPRVLIRTTKGDMEVELFENQAPETVGNFINLVESGFYDNLTFHRVLDHFMVQGGCPNGDGTSGPDYTIFGEMHKPDARKFFRGTLGVALSNNDPNSGGSQFFIMYLPKDDLNGAYTAFGRVVKGIDVLASIQRIDPEAKKDDKAPKEMPDVMTEVRVLSKRDHDYKPNKVQP